jgi:F0F1-type ATP synthase delta subunit
MTVNTVKRCEICNIEYFSTAFCPLCEEKAKNENILSEITRLKQLFKNNEQISKKYADSAIRRAEKAEKLVRLHYGQILRISNLYTDDMSKEELVAAIKDLTDTKN